MKKTITVLMLLFLSLTANAAKRQGTELVFTCPFDGTRITVQRAEYSMQFATMLDGQPYGILVSPVPVAKCPKDGFVIYEDPFSEEDIETLKPFILSQEYRAFKDTETNYWLIYKLKEKLNAPLEDRISSVQMATWEAYNTVNREQYLVYANEAIRLINSLNNPSDELLFLKGELYRRTGDFGNASKIFEVLKKRAKNDPRMGRMIEQQMTLIGEGISSTERAVW